MQKLNNTQVEMLIELVQRRKCLYDKRDESFKSRELKNKAWEDIAAQIGVSDKICRTGWRSLRDQYIKSLKESNRTGKAASEAVGKRKYKYFENLSFLRESWEPRWTSSKYDSQTLTEFTEVWADIDMVQDQIISPEDNAQSRAPISSIKTNFSMSSGSTFSEHTTSTPKKGIDELDDKYLKLLGVLLRKNDSNQPQLDGVDNFFLGLSSTVKNYNLTPSQLAHLQCKIMLYTTKCLENIKNSDNS